MQHTKVLKNIRQDLWLVFSQKEGIDYEETFSLVAIYTSIITIITLVAKMKWKLHQTDVKTDLLNGVIEEEVYI